MWNRQREAEEAREKLARVAEDAVGAEPQSAAGRRSIARAGRADAAAASRISSHVHRQLHPLAARAHPSARAIRSSAAFALASLILFWLWTPLGWLGTLADAWCAYFFRDPVARHAAARGPCGLAGRRPRQPVVNAVPPPELGLGDRPLPRISIFMSVFDCHVNRSPVAGRIERIVYHAGQVPQRRPRQGERGQRAQRASSSRRRAAASAWCRSPGLVARRIVPLRAARGRRSRPASASA